MNIYAIFQVRMGATRLPGKMFKKILGRPLLWHVVQRVKSADLVDRIILATTRKKEDDQIVEFAEKEGIPFSRGSDEDVLDRFYKAAKKFAPDIIVRITPDDPFKDPKIIDNFIGYFLKHKDELDYLSNTIKPTYPEGIDIEIFTSKTLERTWREAKEPSEREHVTSYIWNNPKKFRIKNLSRKQNLSHLRWTIDYSADLKFTREIYKRLYSKKKIFLMDDILKLLKKEPELQKINQGIAYHEGYLKSLKQDKLIKKNIKL